MDKPIREIDGANFATLEEFFDEVEKQLIGPGFWGRNLNAFNDILRGRLGAPVGGFVLVWKNAELSRLRLSNKFESGETIFDILIDIIKIHGPGGPEESDAVDLILQ